MRIEFPGFVDIQVNGFAGVDFNSPETTPDEVRRAVAALRATGVTRFLPTFITGSFDRFARCVRTVLQVDDAAIAGIHQEGPYISPTDGPRGAHPRAHTMAASLDDFKRRQEAANGRIVLLTLAPEVDGALPLIEYLVAQGVRVAIGHSEAPPPVIRDAIRAGATMSTHLGNGCASMIPRHTNLIWEQLASDELLASFIVDGHHLPPALVKSAMRAKTPSRTILTTDAIAAAGSPPGPYRIGETEIDLSEDGRVSLRGTPYLAGSAVTMPESVANAVRFTGYSLDDVLPTATSIPAGYLGIETAGTIEAEWRVSEFRLEVRGVRT
jgi:N-acetylglucosamine-6-phosphate deacetylase